jgi:hypothetical protein
MDLEISLMAVLTAAMARVDSTKLFFATLNKTWWRCRESNPGPSVLT